MKKILSMVLVIALFVSTAVSFSAAESAIPTENTVSEQGVYLTFASATDEELEDALTRIHQEQRARIKTKIALSDSSVTVAKGQQAKLTAEITGIPEGQKASKITWTTSDKDVATCQNGTIAGRANGQATITATSTLSDGTELSSECVVPVYTPVASLLASKKVFDIGVGDTVTPEVIINPKDASNTAIQWESSDPSVATVSAAGVITGEGMGTATITARATDGSDKQVSFTVKTSKKDDRGKTITNSDGVALTVLSVKETKGSSYSRAEDGNIFVLVEMQIENNSSREVSVNGTFGFDAYCDDYSVDYSFSASMNTKNEISTADLRPGKRLKGWKGFEVPQNWKELVVKFTPNASIWGSGEAIEFVIYNN